MKICIQSYRDKFIDNLILLNNKYPIVLKHINKDIYKIHYENNFTHYFFIDNLIDNEIKQFISEHQSKINCIIYYPMNNASSLTGPKQILGSDLPLLYNPEIYYNMSLFRTNDIVAFLDNQKISESLINFLYPKLKSNIKLFNHVTFTHPQNLGQVTEIDKAKILNQAKYCLITNDKNYIIESKACGCIPVDMDHIDKAINLSITTDSIYDIDLSNILTYEQFLVTNIL
jgi:hypothetical protein